MKSFTTTIYISTIPLHKYSTSYGNGNISNFLLVPNMKIENIIVSRESQWMWLVWDFLAVEFLNEKKGLLKVSPWIDTI